MKPEQMDPPDTNDADKAITGDVIGSTAYSERFVLKILLKFANLDSLKDEIGEETFEADLCTLWDMTAEKDVVEFLQKHDSLKLINFALPVIKDDRLIEIILGILGNMCCVKNVAAVFLNTSELLASVMAYLTSPEVPILVQVLRLVNACLYTAESDDIAKWLERFESINYTQTLCFILENSSNKEVLINALENLNTICSQCNLEQCRNKYFQLFVNTETLDGLNTAFIELTVKQKKLCEKDELERILAIALQITLNLVGFDVSSEIFGNRSDDVTGVIKTVLNYYEDYFVKKKQIDMELVDILDTTLTIIKILDLCRQNDLDKFFNQCSNMWLTCTSLVTNGNNTDAENSQNSLSKFAADLKLPASNIICNYICSCDEKNLNEALDKVWEHYDAIVDCCNDMKIRENICDRTKSYRDMFEKNLHV